MQTELTLSYTDPSGEPRQVVVRSARFTIGRSPDNDLAINDSNLSRRHALVESFDGLTQITDSGSQNGTTVNGRSVNTPTPLRDGDMITLGNSCSIRVAFRSDVGNQTFAGVGAGGWSESTSQTATHAAQHDAVAPEAHAAPSVAATASSSPLPSWVTPHVLVAVISGVVILFAAALLYALTRTGGTGRASVENDESSLNGRRGNRNRSNRRSREELTRETTESGSTETGRADSTLNDDSTASSSNAVNPPASNAGTATTTGAGVEPPPSVEMDSHEQVERAAKKVMSRISTDNAPYISDAGVRDVAAKLKSYRGSSALQERLRAMQRGCAEINTQSQNNNLKSSLVMYAALAESEQGGGDPVATARQMLPKMLTLRATFGTATANSTLLTVAAYPYPFNPTIGSQTRTPHPLYTQLVQAGGQKSTVDTSVARSVWFLREQSRITPEAYDLVVRTLALGIIAQNPRQYGINADPLLC